jgi:flavin-binding protein dodecin
MKINQIVQETTTSGSVAPVEHGFVKMQTRNPGVYGNTKAGSLFKGKKTKAPYANSINEGAMKQLSSDLKGGPDGLSDQEFQKKYKMSKQAARQELASNRKQSKPEPVSEAELAEDDIILVPGQGRKMKTGFVPHGKSRVDHEVEMARSDLFSAAQNAQKVYSMIKNMSEEEGLEGWVQEKIIKANDYLNTIREYLEGKQAQGMAEGTEQRWRVTVGNKSGTLSHTKTFTGTKEQAIKQAVTRFATTRNPVVTAELVKQGMAEGAKVDRMVKHIAKSEKKLGKSKDEAENIAWATANKRGMLDNKNKKAK